MLIHRLIRQAEVYNVAVVVSNQVQTQPEVFFGDPTKPTGGNVIAHACTYRIYLKKAGQERVATIVACSGDLLNIPTAVLALDRKKLRPIVV